MGLKKLGEVAFVLRGQVSDDHTRETRLGRQGAEQRAQGGQPAGGSADADYVRFRSLEARWRRGGRFAAVIAESRAHEFVTSTGQTSRPRRRSCPRPCGTGGFA